MISLKASGTSPTYAMDSVGRVSSVVVGVGFLPQPERPSDVRVTDAATIGARMTGAAPAGLLTRSEVRPDWITADAGR